MSAEPRRGSIVIPVWNDAAPLARTLTAARAGAPSDIEIVVVDGGSTDESAAVARAAGAAVRASPVRLRAAQMNLGAEVARGDVLLFLHADTILPAGWWQEVQDAFARDASLLGGAFRRRFVPGSALLRATCLLADVRGRCWGWFLGDQAMFVSRAAFDALGGFSPLRVCEDLDFSRRLARRGRVRLLRATVLSSDRRFHARGALRQTLADVGTVGRFLRRPGAFVADVTQSSAPAAMIDLP